MTAIHDILITSGHVSLITDPLVEPYLGKQKEAYNWHHFPRQQRVNVR